jgi:hypothetical protein
MYWISNRDEANKLVQQAKDAETKIKSHCIQEDEKKKTNIYTDEDRQIYENIQVSDLMNYDKGRGAGIHSKMNLGQQMARG